MILDRHSILNVKDFETHKIDVPKWGGSLYIRPFTALLKDKIEQITQKDDFKGSIRAISLAGSICDVNGNLLFKESDINTLSGKDASSVDIIMQKIFEINGLTESELEEKVKN